MCISAPKSCDSAHELHHCWRNADPPGHHSCICYFVWFNEDAVNHGVDPKHMEVGIANFKPKR